MSDTATATATAPELVSVPATEAPAKRGRGRPRKDGAPSRPRPARPRAVREAASPPVHRVPSANSVARVADMPDNFSIARQLRGLHGVAAFVSGCPEIELDSAEAEMYAVAISDVLREYNIPMSGKIVALLALAGTAAALYIPRAILIKQRRELQRGDKARDVTPAPV